MIKRTIAVAVMIVGGIINSQCFAVDGSEAGGGKRDKPISSLAGLAPVVNEKKSDELGEKTQQKAVSKTKKRSVGVKTVTETPKAGKSSPSKMTGWGISGLVAVGVGLLIWWLIPLKKRKEDKDED